MRTEKGFTLIELLIVIVIIAILAGVMINLLNIEEYRKQARDARRLNDILILQTAITAALANSDITLIDTGNCSTCNSYQGTNAVDGTGWIEFDSTNGVGLKTVIQTLPKDPLNTFNNNFSYYSDGNGFELNTVLESEKYKINALEDGGNDDTIYERGIDLAIN